MPGPAWAEPSSRAVGTGLPAGEASPALLDPRVLRPERVRRLLSRGARIRLRVAGTSMLPRIRPGDHVTLAATDGIPGRGTVVAVSTPTGTELRPFVAAPSEGVIVVARGARGRAHESLPETALEAVVLRVDRRRGGLAPRAGRLSGIGRRIRSVTGKLSRRNAG